MSILRILVAAVIGLAGIGLLTIAIAQDGEEAERSAFVRFVESQISTPDQQIRLGEISGALSSNVTISSITVSDREGAWLTLEGVHLVWSRLALLRGRLDVELLEADRILLPRTARSAEDAEEPEFEVPELPVEVEIDALKVPRVEIGSEVFGRESVLSVDGRMSLVGGSLDTRLEIERVDAAGELVIEARYANDTRNLDLRLDLAEPADGVMANLLGLHGRPAVDFTIAGSGPLDAFEAEVALAADGERLFGGPATISRVATGYRFVTDLTGGIGSIVSPEFGAYVDSGSRLNLDATWHDDESISVHAAELTSGVARVNAVAELAAGGFPTKLDLAAELNAGGGSPVPLPGLGGGATVESATITARLGTGTEDTWSADFDLRGLDTAAISSARTTIRAAGAATRLDDPEARALTFDVSGVMTELGSGDPDIASALGGDIDVAASGQWRAGGPVEVRELRLANDNVRVRFEGDVTDEQTSGTYSVSADSLSLFAGLVGRPIAGAVDMLATGQVALSGETLDLVLDGRTRNLDIGIPDVAGLLEGTVTVAGGVSRSDDGFGFRDFAMTGEHATVSANGRWLPDRSDLTLQGRIADVSRVAADAGGALNFEGRVTGAADDRSIVAAATGDGLTLDGLPFHDAETRFQGTLSGSDVTGDVSLTGRLEEVPVEGSARLAMLADGSRSISALDISAGRTVARGDITLTGDGLAAGRVEINSPDLRAVAPLLMADAAGSIVADVSLAAENGRQSADLEATASGFRYDDIRLGSAFIDVVGEDLLGVPMLNGRIEATDAAIGSIVAASMVATADRRGDSTRYDLQAELTGGTLNSRGELGPVEGGFNLDVETFDLAGGPIGMQLAAPTRVQVRGSRIDVSGALLNVGDGRVRVAGAIDDTIDLNADVTDLPVAIVNAFAPDLQARGVVSGVLRGSGTLDDPVAEFAVRGRGVSAKPLADFGIEDLTVDANGRYAGGTAAIDATADVAGGRITVNGTVGDDLDVTANLSGLPLAIINTIEPGIGIGGTASGTVTATGSLSQPDARFNINARNVTAAPLREAGLSALSIDAQGRLAGDVVRLDRARASGNGMEAEAAGTVPLSGRGLDLKISGTLPLTLTDRFLAESGSRLRGTVRADVSVKGALAEPRLAGTVSADGVNGVGPDGLQVQDISLRSTLDGDTITIRQLSGRLGRGSVSVTGGVRVSAAAGYPADLQIALRNARYTDGDLVTATLNGDLTLRGALADGVVLGGTINVDRAEITVPESLPKSATLLDVRHRNAPPGVVATLDRAGLGPTKRRSRGSGFGLMLDVRIAAPARVFVRGRGLNTEFGGEVMVTGPMSNVRPVGAFSMRRGRIDILGQRITFDRGDLSLLGDLDPVLDFVATTRNDAISVTLTVQGRASDPDIDFTSVPDLPDDEILSRLLFGRSVTELSPLQIGQLAAAAAQLAGGGGSGILDQIRAATGFDNLDVVTDSQGRVSVEVGRYLTDNVYLGVRGGQGSAGVTLNLDITDELTARAEASQEDSGFGIFYEREY